MGKKRVCIVDTPYTLSLYLLHSTEEQISNTYFFVGDNMPSSIVEKLQPNVMKITRNREWNYLRMFLFRLKCLKYESLLNGSEIFAQDHLFMSYGLLGNHSYTLMEDAPGFFDFYKNFNHFIPFYNDTIKGRIRNFFIGANYGKIQGTNAHCISVLLTSMPKDVSLFQNKEIKLCELSKCWNNSSNEKKTVIKRIFGVKEDYTPSKGVVIFTQPFVTDCGLLEEEQIALYSPYIKRYAGSEIYIKAHPRDKLNYEHYFPNVRILKNIAPMQVLSAMGWHFDVAVTVSSSAVSSMGLDTEIIWIGTQVNDKINKIYGDIKCPR